MKAIDKYFPVILFLMLYQKVLTFESVDEILSVTIQVKATEKYFSVVLFMMLYTAVLPLASGVEEIVIYKVSPDSNESYRSVLSSGV